MTSSSPVTDYAWVLENELLNAVRGTRCAVLAASDGMPRFYAGVSKDQADPLSAVATGLLSVTGAVGQAVGRPSSVRQVMAELQDLIFYVIAAGDNGVLAVLAEPSVDAGRLTHRMHELARRMSDQLSTPARIATPETAAW